MRKQPDKITQRNPPRIWKDMLLLKSKFLAMYGVICSEIRCHYLNLKPGALNLSVQK
jgi:hypothetical protein